jgi:hypothetical protein
MFPKNKNSDIAKIITNQKNNKNSKNTYVEKMVATCSLEWVWAKNILTQYTANF